MAMSVKGPPDHKLLAVLGAGIVFMNCAAATSSSSGSSSAVQLLEDTKIDEHRCAQSVGDSRPFVVEWDATDLAAFQATAETDVVFVKFAGCNIALVDGCEDRTVSGRLGAYKQPHWVSGAVEEVAIETENDLYTKLPLGVASFGSSVRQGKKLRLRYFVNGVVDATRDAIVRADMPTNTNCSGATHFVHSYSLGAFALESASESSATGEANLEGFGAGAEHQRRQRNLREAGSVDACEKQMKSGCSMPIRLLLRPIDEHGVGTPETAAVDAQADDAKDRAILSVQNTQTLSAILAAAVEKEQSGDGSGCLEDLERIEGMDVPSGSGPRIEQVKGRCEMRIGQCEQGRERLRASFTQQLGASGAGGADALVANAAAEACPEDQLTIRERLARGGLMIGKASGAGDADACLSAGMYYARQVAKAKRGVDYQKVESTTFVYAARCLAQAARCDDAETMYKLSSRMFFGESMDLSTPSKLDKGARGTLVQVEEVCAAE